MVRGLRQPLPGRVRPRPMTRTCAAELIHAVVVWRARTERHGCPRRAWRFSVGGTVTRIGNHHATPRDGPRSRPKNVERDHPLHGHARRNSLPAGAATRLPGAVPRVGDGSSTQSSPSGFRYDGSIEDGWRPTSDGPNYDGRTGRARMPRVETITPTPRKSGSYPRIPDPWTHDDDAIERGVRAGCARS